MPLVPKLLIPKATDAGCPDNVPLVTVILLNHHLAANLYQASLSIIQTQEEQSSGPGTLYATKYKVF